MIPEGDPIRSLLVEPLPQRSEFCKAEILLANVEAELEGHKRKSRLRIRGIDQGVEQVVEIQRVSSILETTQLLVNPRSRLMKPGLGTDGFKSISNFLHFNRPALRGKLSLKTQGDLTHASR